MEESPSQCTPASGTNGPGDAVAIHDCPNDTGCPRTPLQFMPDSADDDVVHAHMFCEQLGEQKRTLDKERAQLVKENESLRALISIERRPSFQRR